MTARRKRVLCQMTIVIMATVLAACDGGPSEAEYVAACLVEGGRGDNKAMLREMGVKSGEAFCKCRASEARSSLSADARRSMILTMQGKHQESKAIIAKMSEPDRMASLKAGLDLIEKCAGKGR